MATQLRDVRAGSEMGKMNIVGEIADACLTFDGGARITIETKDRQTVTEFLDDLKGIPLTVEIKPYKKKRSLDANAYFWKLLGDLAAKIRVPREEIYRSYIREIGGNSETVCVKAEAAERLQTAWKGKGIGWVTDEMPSKINGCMNVILYYGSSTYDTAQMSRLIDLLVQDCKEQGIQTETPEEIERMIYYEQYNSK